MKIQSIAIPVFIDMILTFSMFFVDTLFLSRISDAAAAGVGVTIPVFVICVILFLMLSQGAANVASQRLGAGRAESVPAVYGAAMLIALAVGLGVVVLVSFVMPAAIGQIGMPAESGQFAQTYLRWISAALVLYGIRTVLGAVNMTQGKPQFNMAIGIVAALVNIPLNIWFMFGMGLGIHGIILATVLSQLLAVAMGVWLLATRLSTRIDIAAALSDPAGSIRTVLRFGLPAAIQPISAELLMLAVAYMTVLLGLPEMAARSYAMNLITLTICWASAWSIGNQILIAGAVGAGQHAMANTLMHRHIGTVALSTLGIAAVLWLAGAPLIGLFTDDPQIVALGMVILGFSVINEPLKASAMMIAFSLKASGETVYPARVSVLINWLVTLPLAWLLCFEAHLGLAGLWSALIIDELLRAGLCYARWRSGSWRTLATA